MKWGPNEDPRQPKQGQKLNSCKLKESIARIANSVPETVLMEEKETDNSSFGKQDRDSPLKKPLEVEEKGMLEVKWRDVTEEEEAGHLEVTSEILLHISPMRPIFQVTLTDSEQILWSLAGRACTWVLLKAIDDDVDVTK